MNDFKKIKEEIIDRDIDLLNFFNDVDKKRCNREWYIERTPLGSDFLGQTICEDKYINIDLKVDKIREKLEEGQDYNVKEKAVLIHELGEADYILSGLPTIRSNDSIYRDLQTILSHKHISSILKNYNSLYDFVYSNLVCKTKVSGKKDGFEKIVDTCWLLTTYPNLKEDDIVYKHDKKEIEDYAINTIMKIIDNIDTLDQSTNNIEAIKDNIEEIIEILKNNGMKCEIIINE